MDLAEQYRRQFAWRAWPTALDLLPPLRGQTVLDLGCSVGDIAAALVARGARVIGVDGSDELLAVARSRDLPGATFHSADLSELPAFGPVDGVWSSFTAAYMRDLPAALTRWTTTLVPGGWLALIDIDDLFGHDPLSPATHALLDAFADDALAAGRYDFRMGRKLALAARQAGLEPLTATTLPDAELAFTGPAAPDVIDAWRRRLARMPLLQRHCGEGFPALERELLACLAHPGHRSSATVQMVLARKPDVSDSPRS